MALSVELKEILVCPVCKGELDFREAEARIVCHACKLVYAIQDDIPNMLVEDAKPFGD